MTTTKKQSRGAVRANPKKLQLNKETLKDLGGSKLAQVKGGGHRCTDGKSGCNGVV